MDATSLLGMPGMHMNPTGSSALCTSSGDRSWLCSTPPVTNHSRRAAPYRYCTAAMSTAPAAGGDRSSRQEGGPSCGSHVPVTAAASCDTVVHGEHGAEQPAREVGVYLPAMDQLGGQRERLDTTLNNFVEREFPQLRSSETAVYSLPSVYIPSDKPQASEAERIVFESLRGLQEPGLGVLFFHGRHYAGRSAKHAPSALVPDSLITREHDFVVLARFQDKHYVMLVEVKSTSDSQSEMLKKSNAREVKDQKRSALNQLRRHREVLAQQLGMEETCIPGIIMWPFLCGRSVDLRTNQSNVRWRDEDFHLFCDTLACQRLFNQWFVTRLERTPHLPLHHWNRLLHRFLLLSCGASVRELGGELDVAMSRDMDHTVALLSVTQHRLLHARPEPPQPTTVHPLVIQGAAGTGKTLLMIKKIEMLHRTGRLGPQSEALFLCYWPGIRAEVIRRLERLCVQHVVTQRINISNDWFIRWCRQQRRGFRHVFVDELESVLISPLCAQIVDEIAALYVRGNADVWPTGGASGAESADSATAAAEEVGVSVDTVANSVTTGECFVSSQAASAEKDMANIGDASVDAMDQDPVDDATNNAAAGVVGKSGEQYANRADVAGLNVDSDAMDVDSGTGVEGASCCCQSCHTIHRRVSAGWDTSRTDADTTLVGHFWVSVDENQRTIPAVFRSVHIPPQPHLRLTSVYRSTRNVFNLFRRLCDCSTDLSVAHCVNGPPVFWVDLAAFEDPTSAVAALVIDLTGSKGFMPNDICVMPFFDDNSVDVERLNRLLLARYQPGSLVPQAVRGVDALLELRERTLFCVTWLLRMKGLECPVVVLVLPAEDVDVTDVLDQRKLYTMMSRCTCLLLLLAQRELVTQLDGAEAVQQYCFSDVVAPTAPQRSAETRSVGSSSIGSSAHISSLEQPHHPEYIHSEHFFSSDCAAADTSHQPHRLHPGSSRSIVSDKTHPTHVSPSEHSHSVNDTLLTHLHASSTSATPEQCSPGPGSQPPVR